MRRVSGTIAIGLAFGVAAGSAAAIPCEVDATGKPVGHCPSSQPAPPAPEKAVKPGSTPATKGATPPSSVRQLKPPPRMLTPQQAGPVR